MLESVFNSIKHVRHSALFVCDTRTHKNGNLSNNNSDQINNNIHKLWFELLQKPMCATLEREKKRFRSNHNTKHTKTHPSRMYSEFLFAIVHCYAVNINRNLYAFWIQRTTDRFRWFIVNHRMALKQATRSIKCEIKNKRFTDSDGLF